MMDLEPLADPTSSAAAIVEQAQIAEIALF
jgi:hypothetical protein